MKHNTHNFIKRWWYSTPDWVISLLIASTCLFGIIYGGCNIRSCSVAKRDKQVYASIQLKYDCPKNKMKIIEKTNIGKSIVYTVDICGVTKKFNCTVLDGGCHLKSCTEVKKTKKIKK